MIFTYISNLVIDYNIRWCTTYHLHFIGIMTWLIEQNGFLIRTLFCCFNTVTIVRRGWRHAATITVNPHKQKLEKPDKCPLSVYNNIHFRRCSGCAKYYYRISSSFLFRMHRYKVGYAQRSFVKMLCSHNTLKTWMWCIKRKPP